jgi:hypothetical protein
MTGNVLLILALPFLNAWWAGAGLTLMMLAMAAQGRGHKGEECPTEPFTGPSNIALRIFFEQWLNFPRFVLKGGWRVAFGA